MRIDDFDYELPEKLISQYPAERRDQSRLMVLDRSANTIAHRHFYDLPDFIRAGDCLVLNDSRVLPARLFAQKNATGASVEILLIRRLSGDIWEIMAKPARRLKEGAQFSIGGGQLQFTVLEQLAEGTCKIEFNYEGDFHGLLEKHGAIPLPPYIRRSAETIDRERYQTIYNRIEGSAAAPTAGLHFTSELLKRIEDQGVHLARVTLHVGIGTFRPVKCERVEDHRMHIEEYHVSQATADLINQSRKAGGRIIAIGTTSTRTLESAAAEDGTIAAGSGETGIFIYPGYRFKAVDAMVTNFHLPKSTLLLLVSAFYNREKMMAAYREAVYQQYRFFSYGDAMLIL